MEKNTLLNVKSLNNHFIRKSGLILKKHHNQGDSMEKLTIEIELTKEQMEAFDNLIEQGCYDQKKYLRRLIILAIERRSKNLDNKMPKINMGG